MKIMDGRKIGDTGVPALVSWSPRADIFAIAYDNAHISLYRINWQKVFDIGPLKEGIPDHITWHPEGQYICLVTRKTISILEIDRVRILTKYNTQDEVVWLKWNSSTYELENREKTEADTKSRSNKQYTEQFMSLLICGCRNGHIYAYSSGQVLLYHITPMRSSPRLKILSGDLSSDLLYFNWVGQRLKTNKSDGTQHTEFLFKHSRCIAMPPINTVGMLSYKFSLLKTTWSQAVRQLNTLADHWSKIYDVYAFYILHCHDMKKTESIAQFYELALNRVESPEIQVFLSASGRDKEVKKKMAIITTNAKSLNDLVPALKIILAKCSFDAQTIATFIRQFAEVCENKTKARMVRKLDCIFRELQRFLNKFHMFAVRFADDFVHFMLLMTYAIHTYNSNDYITEMFDIRKTMRFLDTKVESCMFEVYVINFRTPNKKQKRKKNAKMGIENLLASMGGVKPVSMPLKTLKEVEKVTTSPKKRKKCPTISKKQEPKSIKTSKIKVAKSDWECVRGIMKTLSTQVIPNYGAPIDKVLDEASKLPLMEPARVYGSYVLFESQDTAIVPEQSPCNLWIDTARAKTRVFLQLSNKHLYLFEFDCSAHGATMKSTRLTFSKEIVDTLFYSNDYLTTVTYDPKDKKRQQTRGKTIISQLSITTALENAKESRLCPFALEDGNEYTIIPPPGQQQVSVPTEIKTSASSFPLIRHVLPMANIRPHLTTVSGIRKVGVFVNNECDRILLLDLDGKSTRDEDDPNVSYY